MSSDPAPAQHTMHGHSTSCWYSSA
jgi:hypothetical protein